MCFECNQSYDDFIQFMKKAPSHKLNTNPGAIGGDTLSNNVQNESKDIAHSMQQKTSQEVTPER
jgi:hypothetical protein